jgi:hypothetical protein
VFTHGDVRPANIRVVEDGESWKISGFIDWEFSRFYPEYWESFKMTNNLGVFAATDWHDYLPESVSPFQYLQGGFWTELGMVS